MSTTCKTTSSSDTLDLRRFLRSVRNLKWIYVASFIFFMGMAATYCILRQPQYEINSTMLIEDPSADGSGAAGGMAMMMRTFSVGGFSGSSVNNELQLINSHEVLMNTAKTLGLNRTYYRRDGMEKRMLFLDSPIALEAPQTILDTLRVGMTVTVDIKGDRADIDVTRGRFKTTVAAASDATLPATVKTPWGPLTIIPTSNYTGEEQTIQIDLGSYEGGILVLATCAFAFQIYCDFGGYSDIARGCARMMGIRLMENFRRPYFAVSVTDFWRRWHISLTNWFREYVYFPLGGSRVANQDYMVRNMLVVWLLTGIWHGANWTFLFWGLAYFIFQLAERFFEYPEKMQGRFLKHFYTLMVVNALWVVFRADDLYQAGRFFMNMLGLNNNGFYSDMAVMLFRENWVFFLAGVLFAMPYARDMNRILYDHPKIFLHRVCTVLYPVGLMGLFIVCVSYLASGTYNPFIYFNF